MRIIAHLDMDAFFAAVEERNNPRFFGRPIVVGSDPKAGKGRGVVSTANYKARVYGVRSALPISIAWERAQEAKKKGEEFVFLGVDMEEYERVSSRIRDIILSHYKQIEQTSIDEFYIDCSLCKTYEIAHKKMELIKKEIGKKEKLSCSVGIGPNKLVAKIASDFKKPNGSTIVPYSFVSSFLDPLSISRIPGIGPKTKAILESEGINTISDARKKPIEFFEKRFGKWGSEIFQKVRGLDNDPVEEINEMKSIGAQETFSKDTRDTQIIMNMIHELVSGVYKRFTESSFVSFFRISISVRFSNFITVNKSKTLLKPVSSKKELEFIVLQMFFPFFDTRANKKQSAIRLIGVRLEKLNKQKQLFDI